MPQVSRITADWYSFVRLKRIGPSAFKMAKTIAPSNVPPTTMRIGSGNFTNERVMGSSAGPAKIAQLYAAIIATTRVSCRVNPIRQPCRTSRIRITTAKERKTSCQADDPVIGERLGFTRAATQLHVAAVRERT